MSRARRRDERGYTLLAVLIGISIVSIALVNHGLLAGYGSLASRASRNRLACRQAALAVLNGTAPAANGGSLPPATPVTGWHDTVTIDPRTGEMTAVEGAAPENAVLVDRQWRRGPDADGKTVFEVTATAVDASGRPLGVRTGAAASFSRRVR